MKTKTKLRNKGYIRDKNNFNEGVKLWASYYRANVGRFAIDYLQLPLFPFQMMLIHVMNINNFFYFVGSRGLGKSYLTAIYCCCRAILYPNSKIVVVSGTKGQAKLLISQKIEKELMMMSPNLKREIASVQVGQNVALVKFKNGSTIEAVSGTDNSRGTRCNVLVVDESRLINKDVLSKVVRPFLTVIRQPKFLSKPEYKNYPREENSELYLTSAWYKDHYVYDRFKSFAKGMMNNKPYFACAFPYQLAVEHGLLTQSRVNAIRNEDDMDEIAWIMEMCSIFYGEKSNAFYKSSDINPCRNIYKPWIPPTDLEYLAEKEKSKKKYHLKKQGGEIRIIGCDISVMGGAKNDASVFTLMRLIPQSGEYIRHVVYIESLEGGNAADQAKRIKQLFYDFQADYVALDAQGVGIGVYDSLAKVTYDEERDEEYCSWKSFNDDRMVSRADKNALPVVYTIKVTRVELNHEIAMSLKDCFQKKKIKLLINDMQGKDFMIEKLNMLKKSPEEQARMLKPYLQTTALVNELINLEYSLYGGFVRIREKGSARKDRYSSLAYSNYLAKQLEKDLKIVKNNDMFLSLW